MKIKMRTLAAGPNEVRQPGQIYDVSETEAKSLVEGRYAEYVDAIPAKSNTGPISLEVFSELKADEQKAILAELKIEGDDGNAEKRVALYAAFLETNK